MAAPFKKQVKVLLEKDCEFAIGVRSGKVLELRDEGYLIFWEEWTDPDSGECHASNCGLMSYEAIATENKYGTLKILKRPLVQALDAKAVIRRVERVPIEVARQRLKKEYVLAIQEMLDAGKLRLTRDDFHDNIIEIVAHGKFRYDKYLAGLANSARKRGGARSKKSKKEREKAIDFSHDYTSGHTMWNWYWQCRKHGDDNLFDNYRNCGKYKRYDEATDAFITNIILTLLDKERPSIKSVVESVQSVIDAENEERERRPIPQAKMPRPGYDYILKLIKEYAPLDHKIRKHGWDKAYKDFHGLGVGIETSRALQRVEIDEYTVDLFVLMRSTDLFEHLPRSIKDILGLDGTARRVTLSAAIDVHTRCLLALQIGPAGTENALRHTREMIYSDKDRIADVAGATYDWPMSGAPEMGVLDRGSGYVTDDAYDILSSLGITNMGAPAGKPWLKPFIERVFRTIHSDLLLRFSGRAFSDVVERADNDPAERATLTLEAFLVWLTRWTVDAYHTKKHDGLGMSPRQAWLKAVNECHPRSLTSNEMREVFGVPGRRKLSRNGLRIHHIDYQSDALLEKFVDSEAEYFDYLRWDGDIGTISVRSDNGPWYTVTAKDERWIGKTDADLIEWLEERPGEDPDERRARHNFILDANAEAVRLKRLKGLISFSKTPAELKKDVQRFTRHADTAERRHKAGPYRSLLDDLDDGADLGPEESAEPVYNFADHMDYTATDFDHNAME